MTFSINRRIDFMHFRHHPERNPIHVLIAPVIYSVIVPLVLLDVWVEIYHRICFKACRIPYIKRSEYIRIDRHRLSYLNWYEKINCLYCGYGNGLLRYAAAIAGETEKYWCGIKHAKGGKFKSPPHHRDFLPYGDEAAFMAYVEGGDEGCELKKGNREPEMERV